MLDLADRTKEIEAYGARLAGTLAQGDSCPRCAHRMPLTESGLCAGCEPMGRVWPKDGFLTRRLRELRK